MIAHIKVKNEIHNIEIPEGWYRLQKKDNWTVAKSTDLVYDPDNGKWIKPTGFFSVDTYYAVIRKSKNYSKHTTPYKKVISKPIKKTTKYAYKDSNRNWWTLYVTNDLEKYVPEDRDTEEGFYCGWFDYTLIREDKKIKYEGRIEMQYDEIPSVSQIMLEILNQMNSIAIGFTKYPTEIN